MIEITSELLRKLCPKTPKAKRDRFLPYLNEACDRYGINTLPRLACFLATVCFESDYLKATKEYASGWDYDISKNPKKAKQLGNTQKGDGPKYKGRGLIQLTGKKNYAAFSEYNAAHPVFFTGDYGIQGADCQDFTKYPELLEKPSIAVLSACYYWTTHHLNKYADDGNFFAIQGVVNRGNPEKKALDYSTRQDLYATAVRVLQPLATRPNPSLETNSTSAQESASTPPSTDAAPIASPEPLFSSAIDKVSAPFINAKSKFDQLGVDPASISKSSFWNIALAKVVGWPALIFGFFTDHWEYILGGLVLVAVAYLVFYGAKRNATNRVLAFVQDPGATK